MGDVYRAIDERLDRPVAIKHVQTPLTTEGAERERFRREAKAIARLSHPAIVQIFDVVEDDRGGWIVMELVDGQPLSRLTAEGPVEIGAALAIFADVAAALAEAHGKGILHRDLKADNVMVTPAGRAKLLDFGLARRLDEDAVTIEGRIVGTPYAMSPEQAMSLDLDHRSDLFSLGALLYEALTGERPFRGAEVATILHQVCAVWQRPAHELNPRIPEDLSRLVDRLLEKTPEDRPQSARLVARSLRRIASRLPEEGIPRISTSSAVSDPGRAPSRSPSSGERRSITIVDCELTWSTGIVDPEEVFEVRPEFRQLAERVAAANGGEIGELHDQRLTLLFGYPQTREDDARRALQAARAIVSGVRELAAGLPGEGLSARVGVHSGPAVVVGGGEPKLALGETAKVASGVQSLAPSGEVLLSAATHEVVARYVRTEALPEVRIPGLTSPLRAFRWLWGSDVDTTALVTPPGASLHRETGSD